MYMAIPAESICIWEIPAESKCIWESPLRVYVYGRLQLRVLPWERLGVPKSKGSGAEGDPGEALRRPRGGSGEALGTQDPFEEVSMEDKRGRWGSLGGPLCLLECLKIA